MNRRIKRTRGRSDRPADRRKSDRPRDVKNDHSKNARPKGDRARTPRADRASRSEDSAQRERPAAKRVSAKPPRFVAQRAEKRAHVEALAQKPEPDAQQLAAQPLPTKVQTVVVTADENNMRVDRFLEARFPGPSFSHIQRIVRKGELRVNGKRADSKDRLEEGQSVRIPPLKLDAPKVAGELSETESKTLDALKAMTLYEDDDVLVRNKPAGLAVQGGSGLTRHIDVLLVGMRDAKGQ